MKNILPVLAIALAAAGTLYAMSKEPAEADAATRLPVAAVSAPEITPWILAAARDLGHTQVRAYDGSVFIDVGDDSISYFKEGAAFQMHVAFESKYRHSKSEREPALKALQQKGESIYQHAMQLQARSAAEGRFASTAAAVPAG